MTTEYTRPYTCAAGLHRHHSPDAADRCHSCRQIKDANVRRYFRRQSDAMLRAAGVRPSRAAHD